MLQFRCCACECRVWHVRRNYFWTNLMDSAHRFSLYRMNLKQMPENNHKIITNISNRNTRMRRCQTLFSINCCLATRSEEVICEIQFNQPRLEIMLIKLGLTWIVHSMDDIMYMIAWIPTQRFKIELTLNQIPRKCNASYYINPCGHAQMCRTDPMIRKWNKCVKKSISMKNGQM